MGARENDAERLESERAVYYILSPYRALLSRALRITCIMFAAYLFSANSLLFCVLVPVYTLGVYLYHKLWLLCKTHAFKLPPFLLSIILLNIPFLALSVLIRQMIAQLILYI
ncbi:MAG: hypothetical protein IJZ37_00270 [Clostridia bacterium]|nr:hypothetical protein [Clostridia bacterium]MBQ8235101.1 hypothetical protein [Clostridia bacterium]